MYITGDPLAISYAFLQKFFHTLFYDSLIFGKMKSMNRLPGSKDNIRNSDYKDLP